MKCPNYVVWNIVRRYLFTRNTLFQRRHAVLSFLHLRSMETVCPVLFQVAFSQKWILCASADFKAFKSILYAAESFHHIFWNALFTGLLKSSPRTKLCFSARCYLGLICPDRYRSTYHGHTSTISSTQTTLLFHIS